MFLQIIHCHYAEDNYSRLIYIDHYEAPFPNRKMTIHPYCPTNGNLDPRNWPIHEYPCLRQGIFLLYPNCSQPCLPRQSSNKFRDHVFSINIPTTIRCDHTGNFTTSHLLSLKQPFLPRGQIKPSKILVGRLVKGSRSNFSQRGNCRGSPIWKRFGYGVRRFPAQK